MSTQELVASLPKTGASGEPTSTIPRRRGSLRGSDPNVEHRIRDPEKVRAVIAALAEDIWARPWKGMAGLTDRSAYIALLRIAWHHGEIIPASGVRVSVSMRAWAEKTGVQLPTITKARKRLTNEQGLNEQHALIRRDGRGEGPQSGAFVLLCDPARIETLTQEPLIQEIANKEESISNALECVIPRVALRWGGGKSGKLKEALLNAVRRLRGATVKEIAALLHRKGGEHHLKKHLVEMVGMGLLRRQGDRYIRHQELESNLEIERGLNGEIATDKRVRADHDHQRKTFREAWEKGEVRSQSEARPRKRRPYAPHAPRRTR
jgi:hypothetical protein